jgi:hypothetical protein
VEKFHLSVNHASVSSLAIPLVFTFKESLPRMVKDKEVKFLVPLNFKTRGGANPKAEEGPQWDTSTFSFFSSTNPRQRKAKCKKTKLKSGMSLPSNSLR